MMMDKILPYWYRTLDTASTILYEHDETNFYVSTILEYSKSFLFKRMYRYSTLLGTVSIKCKGNCE